MKPKILVFGAAGFLGAHVVRGLRQQGYAVRGVRERGQAVAGPGADGVEWVEVEPDELVRGDVYLGLLRECRGVVHAAGLTSDRRLEVRRMRSLLDACRDASIARVVYVSHAITAGTGAGQESIVDEHDYYVPGSSERAWIEACWSVEAEIYRYVERGPGVTIVMPTLMLGPAALEIADASGLARAASLRRSVAGNAGPLVLDVLRGRGRPRIVAPINVVDVRDVARSVIVALERGRPGRRYMLGGTNTDYQALVELVRARSGRAPGHGLGRVQVPAARLKPLLGPVVQASSVLPERLGAGLMERLREFEWLAHSRHVQSERARAELGHSERPLEETIDDTVRWLTDVGGLKSKVTLGPSEH